ncbi:MAG: zf-HC2 domain-containing protein [Deltaproteobacteria bacterium]|nr:zf-HC2 domain-containing protein [Deltaproteobacteria bacterium]
MKDSCSSISQLLERYFDRQATDEERSLVERHLPVCQTCHERLGVFEGLRKAIKAPVDEALKEETFPWVWEKIEREIRLGKKPSWQESLRSWLDLSPLFRKKVWIPAMAAAIILVLVISPLLFFKKGPSYSERSVVEYVESGVYNVMVYESEKAKVTIIWLFEGPQNESPAS